MRHRNCNLQVAILQPLMSGMHDQFCNLWTRCSPAQSLQRGELGNGLREAAELIVCKVETLQRGEVADGLREAAELVPSKA